jgi:hypothetical protein
LEACITIRTPPRPLQKITIWRGEALRGALQAFLKRPTPYQAWKRLVCVAGAKAHVVRGSLMGCALSPFPAGFVRVLRTAPVAALLAVLPSSA